MSGSLCRALRAEWTKLRTLPSTGWLLLAAVGLTVLVGYAAAATLQVRECQAPLCYEDLTKISLVGVRLGQAAIVILAVLTVTTEYGTKMIKVTLAAVPGRMTVLAGKLGVVTAAAALAGAAGVLGTMLAARAVLPGNGFTAANGYRPLSLGDHLTLRAATGSVLYLCLVGVLGVGVGLLIRDTAGAVTTVLMLLYGSPMLALLISDPRWQHRIHRYSPMDAGLSIQTTRDFATAHIGPWAGIGVLAAYAGAAIVAGAIALRLRDA
ncbi:ABC transporter permease [Amorphoplanes digitatis]|uniref:ABC-2 type transport system permease protein n=1 Tax=Actinoplanes digitatis TaxID=1868 RepID=A0A7W7I0T8_9ACTN|nr:ABC transporter permease [Actinoplanes digitatis]MBB4764337.1 ABC-2 type transport system permease protein [Actinoplanes digitatis]BFE73744.1 ABC transporter permease subunit [Actinoplanes digitatis]GID94177.1 ABC transporter [Actinoplanes digitatis]